MTTQNEYRCEVLKIAGFALMSPAGKIFLDLPEIGLKLFTLPYFLYLLANLMLLYLGIILVTRGLELIE